MSTSANSAKLLALMRLGYQQINERDPLRLFKQFSRTACFLMEAYSMTIGIIQNQDDLSGIFCITEAKDEETACSYHDTSQITKNILNTLYNDQKQLQLSNPAFLGLPITTSTKKYGVLYFIGKKNGGDFNEADEYMAKTMASELALLYENIKLYNDIRQNTANLQTEIATHKKIEQELSCNQELLKVVLESGKMHGWEWNIQADELNEFGYVFPSRQAWQSFDDFINSIIPEDREKISAAIYQMVLQGRSEIHLEYRSQMATNSIQWIDFRAKIFYGAKHEPQRILGVEMDITELKKNHRSVRKQQAELAHISRINAMGEMASTLAHELVYPLKAIKDHIRDCIESMEGEVKVKEPVINSMRKAIENVQFAGEIIHRMKNFVRKGKLYYEKITINNVIQDVVDSIQKEVPDMPLRIHFDLMSGLQQVEANKVQIEHVITHLINNSIEAMRATLHSCPTLMIQTAQKSEHTITVSIKDNGPGIHFDMNETLFAHHLTRGPEEMGKGLAICHTIIEAHGGQISAETLPEGGACFQFTLPFIHGGDHE